MAYIGLKPDNSFRKLNKQTITGNGGTAYTLTYPVNNSSEIEVYVNNVRQEPDVAYTATYTTLTMTGAVQSYDSFYVVYQGQSIGTLSIPEKDNSGNYNFDNGLLYIDAGNNVVGIGTTTPTIQYGNGLQVKGIVEAGIRVTCNVNTGIDLVQTSTGLGGILLRDNAPMTFSTNDVERVRITSGGNVGIGTSTPGVQLEVSDGTVRSATAYLGGGVSYFGTLTNHPVSFITNNASRGVFTTDGRFGVPGSVNGRITASNYNFNPNTNLNGPAFLIYGSYGGGLVMLDSSDPNSGSGYALWVDDSSNDFNIARGSTSAAASGGVYINNAATSWSARSDIRDKINLEPITSALSKVQTLRTVIGEYVWAEGIRHPFLIAQDVQDVLPEAVSIANKSAPEEEQRLGVSYTDLIPLLVAAIKEQQAIIENLTARIEALEV